MISRSLTALLAGALVALGLAAPRAQADNFTPVDLAQLVLPGAPAVAPGSVAAGGVACLNPSGTVACGPAPGVYTIRVSGTVAAALANGQVTVTTSTPGILLAPAIVPVSAGSFVVDINILGGAPGQTVALAVAGVGDVIPAGLNLPGGFDICCSASNITVVLPQNCPPAPPCPPGNAWNGAVCVPTSQLCPFGTTFNGVACLLPPPPAPPGPPPNLVITKSRPATCVPGTACSYQIIIQNVGPGTFSGTLNLQEVTNTTAPLTVGQGDPAWTCRPSPDVSVQTVACSRPNTTLGPNQSITLNAVLNLPATITPALFPQTDSTQVTNCAILSHAANGTPAAAGTDIATAAANGLIAAPFCVTTPLPPQTAPPPPPAPPPVVQQQTPNLSIAKTAPASCAMGQPCTFQVAITNAGPGTYTGTLSMFDVAEQALFAPIVVAGDPGWQCPVTQPPGMIDVTGVPGVTQPGIAGVNQWLAQLGAAPMPPNATLPPQQSACTRPNTTLRPGESLRLTATVDLSAPNARVLGLPQAGALQNCALLMNNPDGTPMGPGFSRPPQTFSCATAPMPQPAQPVAPPAQPNLTLRKNGPATCAPGQACTFNVIISNTGAAPYNGPVTFQDQLSNTTQLTLGAAPGCTAAQVPGVLAAANCTTPVNLPPNSAIQVQVPVTVPANVTDRQATNCAMLMAPVQGPPSCVPFSIPGQQQAGPPLPPPTLLPTAPNAPPVPDQPQPLPPRDGGQVFPACPAATVPLPGPPAQCCPLSSFNAADGTCRAPQSPPPGPVLRLVKQGPATCLQGERCVYSVFVQNQGPGTYRGDLEITDWLPRNSPDTLQHDTTHPDAANWACGQPQGTTVLLPNAIACRRRGTTLEPGGFAVVRLVIVSDRAQTMVRNCAVVGNRQPQFIRRLVPTDRDVALRAMPDVDPAAFGVTGEPNHSPILGLQLAQIRLPATEDGTRVPVSNGLGPPPRGASCVDTFITPRPGVTATPPPLVPAASAPRDPCPPGFALRNNRCAPLCSGNEVWNGQACVERPRQCRQGQAFIDGRCRDLTPNCPSGTRWDGRTCALLPCRSGEVRDQSGRCVVPPCPQGTFRDRQGRCVQPQVQQPPPSRPPTRCPQGMVATDRGECVRLGGGGGPPPQQQPNIQQEILRQLPGIIQQFQGQPRQQPPPQQPVQQQPRQPPPPVIQQQQPSRPPPVVPPPVQPPKPPPRQEGCPPGFADLGGKCLPIR